MANFEDVTVMRNFTAVDSSVAAIAGRLTNFQTGESFLRPGHMQWLQQDVVPAILARPNAWIDIFGYASKRGNRQFNLMLSKSRGTAIKNFIDLMLKVKGSSIEGKVNIDQGFGEDHPDYIAGQDDNSSHWRAAEVLVFGKKPTIVRLPPVPKNENTEFEIRVVAGGSASIFAQADNYFFQIVDLLRQKTMFYFYTGFGIGISIPKLPGPGSVTKAGPPKKFSTSRSAELHQFNSPASLFQDFGATFGSKSFHGNLRLSINEIQDHKGLISTDPGIIEIEGGWGVQMPGLGSATQGVLASVTNELPFTGY